MAEGPRWGFLNNHERGRMAPAKTRAPLGKNKRSVQEVCFKGEKGGERETRNCTVSQPKTGTTKRSGKANRKQKNNLRRNSETGVPDSKRERAKTKKRQNAKTKRSLGRLQKNRGGESTKKYGPTCFQGSELKWERVKKKGEGGLTRKKGEK